jgi:hypothetical protein
MQQALNRTAVRIRNVRFSRATEPNDGWAVGSRASAPGDRNMNTKADSKKTHKGSKTATEHPGMMGDGTEEQNLGQRGNPAARIKEDEVDDAFGKKK